MDGCGEGRWAGWGEPGRAIELPEPLRPLLPALGVRAASPRVELAEIVLPPSRLSPAAETALVKAVGAEHVRTDTASRAWHSAGKSTPDLVRQRAGQVPDAPDAVVLPGSHDEVSAVLVACTEHRVAVVPFGGGTSVVGGLSGGPGPAVALDLRRLNRLLAVDPVSRTATFQAGVRAPEADRLLAGHGFTLGHLPQSYEYATIGGFAATRSAGQASAGYGRFDDMVVGLTVATPAGDLTVGRAPASAAGPDLRQLFLGSEGALGVITSVTVRVRPRAEGMRYAGWCFPSFEAGLAAVRELAQEGPLPAVVRLSDGYETALTAPGVDGCLLITGGDVEPVVPGGTPLGPEPGEAWAAGRFAAPYLRDALLDAGAFAETLETAGFWSALPDLYAATRGALLDALAPQPRIVLCHVSHVYETGASLYFTVLCPLDERTLDRWAEAKARAGDAILDNGGTISHHHGVGTAHRDRYVREVGPLAVDLLRAVKSTVDPAGILNPGVLVPGSGQGAP